MLRTIVAARRAGVAAAAAALTLFAAAPAHAGTAPTVGCTPQPAFDHPFKPWGDAATYTLSPGGDMETGVVGWALTGGAEIVSGDDDLGVLAGTHVLSLPAGGSVVTAPICIDERYEWARLLARSTGAADSALRVQILFVDAGGKPVTKGSDTYVARDGAWSPTSLLGINTKLTGPVPISFKFIAGDDSSWLLDDFYVDPRARG